MANHLFDALFARHTGSDAVFLRLPDGHVQSYGAFVTSAQRFANALCAHGLKPGDRMALQLEKSPEMLALIAGAIAAGIVFLPLNSAYTPTEIAYFVQDSGAKLLVCDGRFAEPLTPVAAASGAVLSVLNADGSGDLADLARRMEADLGTRLDWVAVDHWNTDNPHVHLIVRGVDDRGGDLVIARDYISSGLRSRAEELVALELGPKPEHEIRHALEREVTAERWTRLDRELRYQADDLGLLDLRPPAPGPADPQIRRLMIGRLQHLRKLGLASEGRPGEWMLGLEAERTLRGLGERGDIIKTLHRAFAERG